MIFIVILIMSVTHFKSTSHISPVDRAFYASAIPADRPSEIVVGVKSGSMLTQENGIYNLVPELAHKLRPTKQLFILGRDFSCVPYTQKNSQLESYVTPYSAFGSVTAKGDIELTFSVDGTLGMEMASPCDGCICGLYLSNTLVPGGKTHSTPNCQGVLIQPDSPLLNQSMSSLTSMGVVKGLLKRVSNYAYTMFTPEISNPIGAYSKTFR